MNGRLRAALTIGAIVGTLALPFALGAALHASGWRPAETVNHGRLLSPPRPLPETDPRVPRNQTLSRNELRGRWWLVLTADGPCEAACLAQVDRMRRIHVALNRDMPRVRRMVLAGGDGALSALQAAHPDLVVAPADAAWLAVLCGDCRGVRLHVVDPQLRVVMRYGPETAPAAVHADLVRLLRHSWSG